jgi:polyisoprenoid-binding protein YceI
MFKKIVLFVLLSTVFHISAQEWSQDKTQTNVVFIIRNFGVNVDGNFSDVKIATNFNSKELKESYINAEIVVKSISTGIESRDNHILKAAYFDEKNHQNIYLKSSKIEKNKTGEMILFATLKIKGITKKLEFPLVIIEDEKSVKITSNFLINRKDFNIDGGGFVVSKTVKVQVEFHGNK